MVFSLLQAALNIEDGIDNLREDVDQQIEVAVDAHVPAGEGVPAMRVHRAGPGVGESGLRFENFYGSDCGQQGIARRFIFTDYFPYLAELGR